MPVCPNCGNEASEGAIFCDQCGTRLAPPEAEKAAPAPAGGAVICPSCGAGNVPGEAFCDFCGSPLEPPEPEVASEVEAEAAPEAEAAAEPEVEAGAEGVPEVKAEAEPVVEAAPEVEAEAEPVAVEAEAEADEKEELTCPVCGEKVLPDEAFCANCGATLAQGPISPEPVSEAEAVGVPTPAEIAPEPVPELEAAIEQATPPPTAEPEAKPPAEAEPVDEGAPATCPACGAEVEPGDAFCSTCGFALKAVPAPSAMPAQPGAPADVGPRLVVSASGAEIPLPDKEEIIVGREDPVSGIYPDVDMTPHGGEEGGVSRQHARLIKEDDKYYVEDLDSTNFTFVNKQKLAPKTRQVIDEGDEIRFGRVAVELKTG